ncbi:hypothetical protein CEXT_654001 [Caerostris extrusa]|uniref:Uncharacterized protein n=1 Tax=Caerostris extrusa TaxID=172846 RepID=A0AAV4VLE1_CAEEX|nr:hypothetical protein CEXT_654001 [Caerostris extrusa]
MQSLLLGGDCEWWCGKKKRKGISPIVVEGRVHRNVTFQLGRSWLKIDSHNSVKCRGPVTGTKAWLQICSRETAPS